MKERPNLVLAIVAAVVVLLAAVAAFLAANRQPPDLDPSTPEGTVQLFMRAVLEGDDDEAVRYLDPSLGCKAPLPDLYRPQGATITLVDSVTRDGTAEVTIDVTEQAGVGLFGSWSHRETLRLRAEADRWLVQRDSWPIYSCR